jgi:alkaline phosphatase
MALGTHKRVLSLTSRKPSFYIAEVKRRNQLLALFCLVVFAGFGVLYFRHWVVQKPFGIILFVGEGLTADRVAALRMYAADAETPLTLDTLSYTALLKNYSNDSAVPDRAAAATALATGVKVNNGALGVDATGTSLTNLLELARASGRVTGLVTDARLTNPTAAAFYAHTGNKDDAPELARTLVESADIDIVLGGGASEFQPSGDTGSRDDARDLLTEADEAGYDVVRTQTELEAVAWWRWPRVFGVFGSAELTSGAEVGPETRQPSLSNMVRRAVELLQIHRGGFLLVVDAALMRKAAEENDAEGTLTAMLELDRAISVALRFAGTKTTVFVCGDVGVGGLKASGFAPRAAGKSDLFASTAVTWASGPNGRNLAGADPQQATANVTPAEQPAGGAAVHTEHTQVSTPAMGTDATAAISPVDRPEAPAPSSTPLVNEVATPTSQPQHTSHVAPAAIYAPAALHTVEDVIAYGHGRGAEALHGTLESTRVFEIIRDNL